MKINDIIVEAGLLKRAKDELGRIITTDDPYWWQKGGGMKKDVSALEPDAATVRQTIGRLRDEQRRKNRQSQPQPGQAQAPAQAAQQVQILNRNPLVVSYGKNKFEKGPLGDWLYLGSKKSASPGMQALINAGLPKAPAQPAQAPAQTTATTAATAKPAGSVRAIGTVTIPQGQPGAGQILTKTSAGWFNERGQKITVPNDIQRLDALLTPQLQTRQMGTVK